MPPRLLSLLVVVLLATRTSACEFCGCAQCAYSDSAPLPPNVQAYSIQGGRWPGQTLGQPLTLTYSYHNVLDGGLKMPNGQPLPSSIIKASIEEALSVWAAVVPIHFVEVPDQQGPVYSGNYPSGQFGQLRFAHRYINGPDVPGAPPTTKALAYFPSAGGNLAGDVFFDNSDPWQEVGTIPTPDVLGAAIHEIGHTLGLGHSDTLGANMYWTFLRSAGLGTGYLTEDDLTGIRLIYGAGVGSVTPLPQQVPEPSTLLLAVVALFAAGRRRMW